MRRFLSIYNNAHVQEVVTYILLQIFRNLWHADSALITRENFFENNHYILLILIEKLYCISIMFVAL